MPSFRRTITTTTGFSDAISYRCYRVRDPEQSHSLYGYVERGTELDESLLRALRGKPFAFVTVRLRYPGNNPRDTSARQIVVDEILEEGWVPRGGSTLTLEES